MRKLVDNQQSNLFQPTGKLEDNLSLTVKFESSVNEINVFPGKIIDVMKITKSCMRHRRSAFTL
jgi:hypothetical protein